MKINWNVRLLLLLPVLVGADLAIRFLVTEADAVPLWLDSFGPLLGACIGGPLYGILVAVLYGLCAALVAGGLPAAALLFIAADAGVAACFGTYARLGFFSSGGGMALGVGCCSLIEACLRTPMTLALYGGVRTHHFLVTALFQFLTAKGVYVPAASFVSFFLFDLVDKALVLAAIAALVRLLPLEWFREGKKLPQAVVVNTPAEEEFQAESDRMKAKAQEKLDKQKEKEEPEQEAVQREAAAAK